MATISLCMIVKNEEDTLERCLNSVKNAVDEIIIVDTGSTDRTKEIALAFTNKIFDFQWIDNFSAARNYSFEQATMDYILWLDADDVFLPKDEALLIELKKDISAEIDVVMMKYNTSFDRDGKVNFSYFRERLTKRSCGFEWREPVHEYIKIGGRIINSDICVTHAKLRKTESGRNLRIYEAILDRGEELTPRGMYYYARELAEHRRYSEAVQWITSFLDTGKGWVEDSIAACDVMADCYTAENKHKEALTAMLRSFSYDVPRAEICCKIGYYFKSINRFKQAIYWFETVLRLERDKASWGFTQDDCWGFIPCLECAVCYDKLGDYKKASDYNDKAAEYKPDSPSVIYNKQYFKNKLGLS